MFFVSVCITSRCETCFMSVSVLLLHVRRVLCLCMYSRCEVCFMSVSVLLLGVRHVL